MSEKTFNQRKFRARSCRSHSVHCDTCGKDIPPETWFFVRIEGHYGMENPFNPHKRVRHIEKKEIRCRQCVEREDVVKTDRALMEGGNEI